MAHPFQFRIRTLLLISAVVGCNAAVLRQEAPLFYFVSIPSLALVTCYFCRFERRWSQVDAGLWAVAAAMAWGAGVVAAMVWIESRDLVDATFAGLIGGVVGFYVGLVPVLVLALVPERKSHDDA